MLLYVLIIIAYGVELTVNLLCITSSVSEARIRKNAVYLWF